MRSTDLEIASPCHENWDAMRGEGSRRFCGVCQKDVHDLSALAQDEAHALLREHAGEALCVRYTSETDGSLRFRDLVPLISLTRKIVRTAFAAAALAACTPHGEAPVHDLGDAVIEAIRADTVPTPDGGCDYTTGPFTTFHFPAGHTLCQQADDGEFAKMGKMPAYVPPPPMLESVTPPPVIEPVREPMVDPVQPPRMGQAMVAAEPKDPFVPCDPVAKKPPPEPRRMPVKGGIRAPHREAVPAPPKPESTAKMGLMMADD
jgi:hypothetical protein